MAAVKVFLTDWYVMMPEGREGYKNLWEPTRRLQGNELGRRAGRGGSIQTRPWKRRCACFGNMGTRGRRSRILLRPWELTGPACTRRLGIRKNCSARCWTVTRAARRPTTLED